MKVKVTFEDKNSLTAKEIVQNLKHIYGNNIHTSVTPTGDSPESYIYFGMQELLTGKQVESFFDDGHFLYQERIRDMRRDILDKVEIILNQLIADNEQKLIDE
tara:strand:+ start:1262 stop:1570 length:309 start_codon:yes stop_codon:yes gene_type:complete